MGFNEGKFLQGIDDRRKQERRDNERNLRSNVEVPPVVVKLHERLKKTVFNDPNYTVQAPEFFSVYGKDAVVEDMKEVLAIKKRIASEDPTAEDKKMTTLSETFEGIVLLNAKNNKWFGDATFFKTSAYDDIKNKTDMFGEWYSAEEGSRVLALAVDLTFSRMKGVKKLVQIKKEIESGKLHQIRYFKDERGDYKGTRFNVPRIVLGVGSRELIELASLTLLNKQEHLKNHPARDKLVHEMHMQLKGMERYARKIGQEDVARSYQQALAAVGPLFEKSKGAVVDTKDPVFQAISDGMKSFE